MTQEKLQGGAGNKSRPISSKKKKQKKTTNTYVRHYNLGPWPAAKQLYLPSFFEKSKPDRKTRKQNQRENKKGGKKR